MHLQKDKELNQLRFIEYVYKNISELEDRNIIIGDFNTHLNPEID